MARADERRFVVFRRGYVRDRVILANYRIALRDLVNPDTRQVFTEDEIAVITQEGSRYWIEADAIDLVGQAYQQRAIYFVNQTDPRTASSVFLKKVWGPLWVGDMLPASAGSGTVTAQAIGGTVWTGSTTIGAPGVIIARDPAGKRYQLMFSATTPGAIPPALLGVVTLTFKGIDTGASTNPATGTELTFVNPPPGAQPTCLVAADFSGGFDAETEQEYATRIADEIGQRPASGNNAQMKAWATRATVAVEAAFVYACAAYAGSTFVCVLQKRGTAVGPLARLANLGTMTDVVAYVTPPNSPVVPERVFVLASTALSQSSNATLNLTLDKGTTGGWADLDPWPRLSTRQISNVTNQTHFSLAGAAGDLPGGATTLTGADAPQMMIWNVATSRFEKLQVTSVTESAPGTYDVVLTAAPAHTLTVGDWVSPYTDLQQSAAETLEKYFDALGPGELVSLTSDVRGARAFRFPRPGRLYPYRVGSGVTTWLEDALGSALIDSTASFSRTSPDLPADISDGPNQLTLGKVSLLEL